MTPGARLMGLGFNTRPRRVALKILPVYVVVVDKELLHKSDDGNPVTGSLATFGSNVAERPVPFKAEFKNCAKNITEE